ncbi:hypothetical protein U1Q18_039116, partial [Sarracenia purpurea var. burkii]
VRFKHRLGSGSGLVRNQIRFGTRFGSGKKKGESGQVREGNEKEAVKGKSPVKRKGNRGFLAIFHKSSAMEVVGAVCRHGAGCARRVGRRGSAERCAGGTR